MTGTIGPRATHGDGWEYTTDPINGWQVRARYDGPSNVEFLHDGVVFTTLTVPGYSIWNYAAHLADVIPELEKQRRESESAITALQATLTEET